MAALQDLISQISDPILRSRIEQEVNKLSENKKFGLVFEEHIPEVTALYDIPIQPGCLAMLKNNKSDKTIYTVDRIDGDNAVCINEDVMTDPVTIPIADIVCVAQFGQPIYPYLQKVDSICNAPDSDLWHTLIEADNYHALQLLIYLYEGKVDCIYIDPPYNTGARDWKYNNNYVDSNDQYRHSKWLSMIEKRLKLAKKLLKPEDSVLIVTIDEKEYLHLGCLLEELFPNARIQMVTDAVNPFGSSRKDIFSRSDEYIFFCFFGNAHVFKTENDMLHSVNKKKVLWDPLWRRGANGPRTSRPNLFYPIFFREKDGSFYGVGKPLPKDMNRRNIDIPNGCFAVFPIGENGNEVSWGLSPDTFMEKYKKGYIKFGKWSPGAKSRAMYHLQTGSMDAVENGEIEVLGYDNMGTLILGESHKAITPMTTWSQPSHNAGVYGSRLLKKIFPEIRFDYPKSVYATEDALRFVVRDKTNALIVDFFAGSGTTLHAVNLLNAEDNGHRRCIMVTNNEVSDTEAKSLTKQGYHLGDAEWERYGIAQYVTWPRTVCSIEGHDINGNQLKGKYISDKDIDMSDGFKANAIYFKLGFLDKDSVALGRQFRELLPVFWMKAGCIGPCPSIDSEEDLPQTLILPENGFAVLLDHRAYIDFVEHVSTDDRIKTVYIVTDSESEYGSMISEFDNKETYQIYRDYLDNFRINTDGRV